MVGHLPGQFPFESGAILKNGMAVTLEYNFQSSKTLSPNDFKLDKVVEQNFL